MFKKFMSNHAKIIRKSWDGHAPAQPQASPTQPSGVQPSPVQPNPLMHHTLPWPGHTSKSFGNLPDEFL